MPYYNITLTDNPIQSKNAETITFASKSYWVQGDDKIDMSDSNNYINDYITAYEVSLKNLGVSNVTVEIARYSDLSLYGMKDKYKNPGNLGCFWIGSSRDINKNAVYYVYANGGILSFNYWDRGVGVRPIIEIPIE